MGRRGSDAETSAQHFDAFPHTDEAQVFVHFCREHALDIEGSAIVMDFQTNEFGKLTDRDLDHGGLGMLGHIGKSGLRHAEEHGSLDTVELFAFGAGIKSYLYASPFRKVLQIGIECRDDTQIIENRGSETAGKSGG
jgi:hypothetical protein